MNANELDCYIKSGIDSLEGTREKVDIKLEDILEDEQGNLFRVILAEERDDIFEPVHIRLFNLRYEDSKEPYNKIYMERSYYPNVYDEVLKLKSRKNLCTT